MLYFFLVLFTLTNISYYFISIGQSIHIKICHDYDGKIEESVAENHRLAE